MDLRKLDVSLNKEELNLVYVDISNRMKLFLSLKVLNTYFYQNIPGLEYKKDTCPRIHTYAYKLHMKIICRSSNFPINPSAMNKRNTQWVCLTHIG